MKHLILTFGFRHIQKLCEEKGWELPFAADLDVEDIEYDEVWVQDLPEKEEDRETHAMLWSKGKLYLCNKNFKQHVVVHKKPMYCPHCREEI